VAAKRAQRWREPARLSEGLVERPGLRSVGAMGGAFRQLDLQRLQDKKVWAEVTSGGGLGPTHASPGASHYHA